MDNALLYVEIQLKKDEIVRAAINLVKDHDSDIVRGMTEVSARLLKDIEIKLGELEAITKKLS